MAFGVLASAMCLTGCDKPIPASGEHHGRYVGIGVFEAADLWSRMKPAESAADATRATLADDQHIIVIEDSVTGEVRECGDLSGFCVAMNPWTKAIARERQTPVALSKHAGELQAERDAMEPASASAQSPH
jgi:hypothetical protein